MSAGELLELQIADLQVEVRCSLGEVMTALRSIWGGSAGEPARARHRLSLDVVGELPFTVRRDARAIAHSRRREDVLPTLEAVLYHELRSELGARYALLHSAAVTREGVTALLVGASGAGKSTLARCALRRGARYLGDEIAVTDGRLVWGLRRAVQFTPVADGEAIPPWLAGADVQTYKFAGPGDRALVLPHFPVPPDPRLGAPELAHRAHVVTLCRGERDELEPVAPVRGLARLIEALYSPTPVPLSGLVGPGRSWTLRWRDPEGAWELLERAIFAGSHQYQSGP